MAIKVAGQEVISDTRKITGAIGLDLTPIEATIADTAVDVFVYDTRKDSDGGAWRKRTQHTSWYNETLNTATRGSRKEFPAVAVIVADNVNHTVTIYDGDDPDLPMWMVFSDWDYRPTNRMIGSGDNGTLTACLAMLNGKLAVGVEGSAGSAGSWDGLFEIDFLKDHSVHRNITSTTYGVWDGNISTRNTGGYPATNSYSVAGIVNTQVNDIAMTVLPNAPIDPATQLPIPTIAVATDGGVSVIKDDGSVVDITFTDGQSNRVLFNSNEYLTVNQSAFIHVLPIPSYDKAYGVRYAATADDIAFYPPTTGYTGITAMLRPNKYSSGYGIGYEQVSPKGNLVHGNDVLAQTMEGYVDTVNNITSTYNTGWMNGDIKLATLSDTDATNVTGTELVTNGTFDTDTSGWSANTTLGSTTTFNWNANGSMDIVRSPNGYGYGEPYQSFTTVIGKRYVLTVTSANTSTAVAVGNSLASPTGVFINNTTVGVPFSKMFTAEATTTYVSLTSNNSNTTTNVDNISVRLAEEDRSVNGNGLQVFGTVTKTPVNTGADLVAYSGFGGSNYLQQPYNSDMDFGTGDFCILGWMKLTNVTSYTNALYFKDVTQSRAGVYARTDVVGFWVNTAQLNISGVLPQNTWTQYALVRKSGVMYCYVNGQLKGYTASTYDLTNLTGLYIGEGGSYLSNSLIRISATAPTAEQIAKIYEDERPLFMDGAQATLYGSSDAVTALAYDEDESILRVGTSSGRSDFRGLRRVSNTTTGVTTAISSSNGMVVEQ